MAPFPAEQVDFNLDAKSNTPSPEPKAIRKKTDKYDFDSQEVPTAEDTLNTNNDSSTDSGTTDQEKGPTLEQKSVMSNDGENNSLNSDDDLDSVNSSTKNGNKKNSSGKPSRPRKRASIAVKATEERKGTALGNKKRKN